MSTGSFIVLLDEKDEDGSALYWSNRITRKHGFKTPNKSMAKKFKSYSIAVNSVKRSGWDTIMASSVIEGDFKPGIAVTKRPGFD